MHVPGWLLQILISYLTDRSMFMRYSQTKSTKRSLPGSSPQGTFLGVLLFIIVFNGALLRPSVPRPDSLNLKYIDDLSLLQALNLKDLLIPDPVNRPMPLAYSERNRMILPCNKNPLQYTLAELKEFTDMKNMIIKGKKTNLMKFNFKQSYDFPAEINIEGFQNQLSIIHETKLLGIIISEDLKWSANTDYLCSKAYRKIWVLRRMKILDVDTSFLLDVYQKEVRSVLELAVPAWHSGITRQQSYQIERVQRTAVSIILGDRKLSYGRGLALLGLETLQERRVKLCKKSPLKSRHRDMFTPNMSAYDTRTKKPFREPKILSQRAFNSPLAYLTRLVNKL